MEHITCIIYSGPRPPTPQVIALGGQRAAISLNVSGKQRAGVHTGIQGLLMVSLLAVPQNISSSCLFEKTFRISQETVMAGGGLSQVLLVLTEARGVPLGPDPGPLTPDPRTRTPTPEPGPMTPEPRPLWPDP